MNREIHHLPGHLSQVFQSIRNRRQMVRRTEMLVIIDDHLIKQGIPDIFLAFKILIHCRLDHPKGCGQF